MQELTYSFASHQKPDIIALSDRGQSFALGRCTLKAVPAYFLHSVGNVQLFDPLSKILFSGDMGASMLDDAGPVVDFAAHLPSMLGFHRRYMASHTADHSWGVR